MIALATQCGYKHDTCASMFPFLFLPTPLWKAITNHSYPNQIMFDSLSSDSLPLARMNPRPQQFIIKDLCWYHNAILRQPVCKEKLTCISNFPWVNQKDLLVLNIMYRYCIDSMGKTFVKYDTVTLLNMLMVQL